MPNESMSHSSVRILMEKILRYSNKIISKNSSVYKMSEMFRCKHSKKTGNLKIYVCIFEEKA